MTLAKEYHLNLLHNLALLRFCLVLVHLDYVEHATNLLGGIMPFLLTNADIASQALAFSIMATCHLGKKTAFNEKKAINYLQDALKCKMLHN
jgi:hypothetical protein